MRAFNYSPLRRRIATVGRVLPIGKEPTARATPSEEGKNKCAQSDGWSRRGCWPRRPAAWRRMAIPNIVWRISERLRRLSQQRLLRPTGLFLGSGLFGSLFNQQPSYYQQPTYYQQPATTSGGLQPDAAVRAGAGGLATAGRAAYGRSSLGQPGPQQQRRSRLERARPQRRRRPGLPAAAQPLRLIELYSGALQAKLASSSGLPEPE